MDDDNPFTKSQTIDPEVRSYVYSLVNALGGSSGDESGRYILGDDALAVLRDLKRWLKLYDEKTNRLDVARCLAEAKVVTGDLLPILASWSENGKNDRLRARAALACLELLVPLTWPLEQTEMTVNHCRHTPYLYQSQVLYKAGILSWDNAAILRQAIRVALPSIALKRDERTPRDEAIIRLMLYFVRNITIIRQIPNLPSQGFENEVSRSATIEAFRAQDVFALVLTISSNMGEDFNLQDVIVLEILFNMVKGVNVQKLWLTESERRGKEVSDLKATLTDEASLHKDAKKSEWSRHGRFGTMIWVRRTDDKMSAVSGQDNLRDGKTALFNIDKSKKWSKPQRKQRDANHTIYDFDREVHITSTACEKLRNFVEEFLDAGFNPLFVQLRKAIEREADRLVDVNYRQFFYTVAWFLHAERVRRDKQRREIRPANLATDFEAESFSLVAGVLNQEMFITLNRYMQNSIDNKEWQDLNASMRCFTQILLTVQEMSKSSLEEDQEIAENIQNRIFYEETTHDRIIGLLKGYKDQGFGYLDAVTELSHVFLRMLERYSKENADLQIRSRRKAQRKQKETTRPSISNSNERRHDDDEESENEDAADVVQISRERKFDFKRFAAKFVSQSSIDTFVAFTAFFQELSPEQLKRAHRFFYRVAFKHEMGVLLYRVDIIALLYKMVEGPEGLSRKHAMFGEWSEFSRQLFRRMFKKLDERPELLVEFLFSKISRTIYYLEYGHDKISESSTRIPAEIEIKPSAALERKEQIGIVVTLLLKDEKQSLVDWVKSTLAKVYDERIGWEAEAEARKEENPPTGDVLQHEPLAQPGSFIVRPKDAVVQTAMFRNARLKLLMRLVDFEILGLDDAIDATWVIPSSISSSRLADSRSSIETYELSPWVGQNADDVPEDMIRRARRTPNYNRGDAAENEAIRDGFIDDSEGDENPDLDEEFLFPDNIRSKPGRSMIEQLKEKRQQKRKRNSADEGEIDEELEAQRRKARQLAALERRRKIKSELYIRDSDDESDIEKDKDFFAREEQTRRRQTALIRQQMSSGQDLEKRVKTRKVRAKPDKKKASMHNSDEELRMSDSGSDASSQLSNEEAVLHGLDDSQSETDTPISSPPLSNGGAMIPVLKEIAQPRSMSAGMMVSKAPIDAAIELEDGSEEDEIPNAPKSRRRRGGFILDSDDDE